VERKCLRQIAFRKGPFRHYTFKRDRLQQPGERVGYSDDSGPAERHPIAIRSPRADFGSTNRFPAGNTLGAAGGTSWRAGVLKHFEPHLGGRARTWHRIECSKAPWASDDYSGAGRTILATYIIASAKQGERDAKWLADSTVLYLSQQRLSQTPPDDSW